MHIIAGFFEGLDELGQKFLVPAYGQALDVLEDESASIQILNKADEVECEFVARIIEDALADKGEALAGGAAKHAIDFAITDARSLPNLIC